MRPPRNPAMLLNDAPPARPNLRRHGRLRCDLLVCTLGTVVDLSASGMRVSRTGKGGHNVGDTIDVRLQTPGLALCVRARVVHLHRSGLLRWNIGLEFVEVTPAIAKGLMEIARVAMDPVLHQDSSI